MVLLPRKGVCFDSYNVGLSTNGSVFSSGPLSQSFTTDPGTTQIKSGLIFLLGSVGQTISAISRSLCVDNSGVPGAVVATLGQIYTNPLPFSFDASGGVSFGISINAAVSGSTRYWLKLSAPGLAGVSWPGTTVTGWNTTSAFWADSSGSHSATSGHGCFQLLIFTDEYQPPMTQWGPVYY